MDLRWEIIMVVMIYNTTEEVQRRGILKEPLIKRELVPAKRTESDVRSIVDLILMNMEEHACEHAY